VENTWSEEGRNSRRLKILHIEELYNLYFSANIFSIIKSRKMRILGLIAYMGEKKNACRDLVEN
jgi:hypothetical protein